MKKFRTRLMFYLIISFILFIFYSCCFRPIQYDYTKTTQDQETGTVQFTLFEF